LVAFLFFYTRAPASLISWSVIQQAFNGAMLLLLDALETGNLSYTRRVEQSYVVFRELQDNGVHRLAGLAVEKLSWGLDQLHKRMGASSAHSYPTNGIDTKDSVRDDTNHIAEAPGDTVMSNTGMLLLEEPGLQSFAPERFAPFAWSMPEVGSNTVAPDQPKQEQEMGLHSKTVQLAGTKLECRNDTASILGELQGNATKSQRSAFGRYCTPVSHEHYPPKSGVTGPASPVSLAAPVPQRDHDDDTLNRGDHRPRQNQSPHLQRTDSRPTSPPAALLNIQELKYRVEGDRYNDLPQAWAQPTLSSKQCQMSASQLRHNSCPSLHQSATTPPLLRPTYSSPIANKFTSSVIHDHYSVHTPWSANPPAPRIDSVEPGMAVSPMSGQGLDMQGFYHRNAQQQQLIYQHPFSDQPTIGSVNSIAVANVEQLTVDQWKRWVGSEGG
jgi:hypothetical protein